MRTDSDTFIKKGATKAFAINWLSSTENLFGIEEYWCDLTIKKEWPKRTHLQKIINNMNVGDFHSIYENNVLIFIHCLTYLNKDKRK